MSPRRRRCHRQAPVQSSHSFGLLETQRKDQVLGRLIIGWGFAQDKWPAQFFFFRAAVDIVMALPNNADVSNMSFEAENISIGGDFDEHDPPP